MTTPVQRGTNPDLVLVRIIIDKVTGAWVQALKQFDSDADYLCRLDQVVWVSSIYLLKEPDGTMPKNCREGCLYVQPKGKGPVLPVDQLDDLYYITQNVGDEE